jgi:hypothetical protein
MRRHWLALATLIVGLFLTLAPVAVGASTAATAPSLSTANTSGMSWSQCMGYYHDLDYCCAFSYNAPFHACNHDLGDDFSSAITPTRTEL